jgi:adenylosuccinate synthase
MLNWFNHPGVSFVVDGAFGSTGKGAASAWIYANSEFKPDVFTTNASPNAGHTAYWKGNKIVTRHLSIAGVIDAMEGGHGITYLNAGAIIDEDLLRHEIDTYGMEGRVFVSPKATVILPRHKENHPSLAAIASTQKGTGPAMADRLLRYPDVIYGQREGQLTFTPNFEKARVLCEVPQGFSLGLHSGFYPYTTNRECTVLQGASDLGCSHRDITNVMMTIRTFPIRVGNTADGTSGPCYPDQQEISWSDLGVEPEVTTVTKRVRRVFTFSDEQFRAAVRVNAPNSLWLGFMDYLDADGQEAFYKRIMNLYLQEMHRFPDLVVGSFGPMLEDAKVL